MEDKWKRNALSGICVYKYCLVLPKCSKFAFSLYSESSIYPSLEKDSCVRNSVYVIDDHFPQPENLLATEV